MALFAAVEMEGGRAHKHEKLNPGCGSATFAPVAAVKHEYTSAVHIHKRFRWLTYVEKWSAVCSLFIVCVML